MIVKTGVREMELIKYIQLASRTDSRALELPKCGDQTEPELFELNFISNCSLHLSITSITFFEFNWRVICNDIQYLLRSLLAKIVN